MEYIINPVLMGGVVNKTGEDFVKINLHGRLGVITVPRRLVLGGQDPIPGHELQFYFSYLQINERPYDYDTAGLQGGGEMVSVLIGAELTEVNDTAVKARIQDGFGTVAVPRRWVFTEMPLAVGQTAEFYLSQMKVIGKRKIPAESI